MLANTDSTRLDGSWMLAQGWQHYPANKIFPPPPECFYQKEFTLARDEEMCAYVMEYAPCRAIGSHLPYQF